MDNELDSRTAAKREAERHAQLLWEAAAELNARLQNALVEMGAIEAELEAERVLADLLYETARRLMDGGQEEWTAAMRAWAAYREKRGEDG